MGNDLPDYMQRVLDEKQALDEKLEKLGKFLRSNESLKIAMSDYTLLTRQHTVMQEYSDILGIRLAPYLKD